MKKFKCYKVIEEQMTSTGRLINRTLPLYHQLSDEEINGTKLLLPKETNLNKDSKYVYAFINKQVAIEYVQEHFKGYLYTRPVIYECEAENSELPPKDGYKMRCLSIKFVKPLYQYANYKLSEYVPMSKPESKKAKRGFDFDENEINGDIDYNED